MESSIFKKFWSQVNPATSRSMTPVLLIVYVIEIIIFNSLNPLFLTVKNYQIMGTQVPILGILALGLGIVLISGNVDISVGATVGVVAMSVGKLIENSFFPAPPVIVIVAIAILIGLAIGAINGFVTSYIGVNSIIVTLGMWATLKGLARTIGKGTVYYEYKAFQDIGRGYIFKVIPNVLFFFVLFLVVLYLVLRFTKFGRNVYLVGANDLSARAVGVNVKRTKFLTFLFSGGLAAVASVLFVSQAGSANAWYGTGGFGGSGWEFRALTICIVGGLSISGGKGTYLGLFVGFLILSCLSNGLTLINMPLNWRDFFEGSVLLFAIILDSRRARSRELII